MVDATDHKALAQNASFAPMCSPVPACPTCQMIMKHKGLFTRSHWFVLDLGAISDLIADHDIGFNCCTVSASHLLTPLQEWWDVPTLYVAKVACKAEKNRSLQDPDTRGRVFVPANVMESFLWFISKLNWLAATRSRRNLSSPRVSKSQWCSCVLNSPIQCRHMIDFQSNSWRV